MQLKTCTQCDIEKSVDNYGKLKSGKDGLHPWCSACRSKADKRHYQANSEKIKEQAREYRKTYTKLSDRCPYSRIRSIVNGINQRDKYELKVSVDYLYKLYDSQDGICSYTGLPLTPQPHQFGTISLDRIDSDLPYQKGNLHFISARVNIMKNSLPEDDFLFLCKRVTEHQQSKITQ